MKTTHTTKKNIDIVTTGEESRSLGHEASKLALDVGSVGAALVGLWGLACMVGAVVNSGGVGEVVKGYLTAVTGG